MFTDAAINAVNAARAYYGLHETEVITIDSRFRMIAEYSPSGLAAGRVEGLDTCVSTTFPKSLNSVCTRKLQVRPQMEAISAFLRVAVVRPEMCLGDTALTNL